ncbi:MAG: Ppx/GppA family phosphatase [Alphaproteobacteria bacterium]|nr:Ppx/GppA family phosphatase [Alphaproteobacteria bacterium]
MNDGESDSAAVSPEPTAALGPRAARRGPPGARRAPPGPVFGALDLGTNNCRLLLARPSRDGFRVVDGFSRVVRLGEGVGETGALSDAAMARAIEALKVCAGKLARRHPAAVRAVATEACRAAANGTDFIARAREATGISLEIISSREEAELTLAGCLPLLETAAPHALVFDVGGGSAEIVWLRREPDGGSNILGWVSLPCGVVTITERNGGHDFTPAAYAAVVAEVEAMLAPFETRFAIRDAIAAGGVQMLGTAGTVTTVAGVNLGLPRYNRRLVDGSFVTVEAIRRVTGDLARTTFAERLRHPCIGENRADLVVAGCAVLEAICNTWPIDQLRVADRGVREGILVEMMAARRRRSADGRGRAPRHA